MMGAVLFGYLIRLGLIFLAVLFVKDAGWISLPALGTTIIVTHLGLLVWEMKYVAISLAYPGLKPSPPVNTPANAARTGDLAMLGFEFPADQRIHPLAGHLPRLQQGRRSSPSSPRSSASSSSCSPAARIR